jgi:hypothetical protein
MDVSYAIFKADFCAQQGRSEAAANRTPIPAMESNVEKEQLDIPVDILISHAQDQVLVSSEVILFCRN